MKRRNALRLALAALPPLLAIPALISAFALTSTPGRADQDPPVAEPHRSPIALALSGDGARLLTANQTSNSVSLVDTAAGKVLAEITTGEKPAGVAMTRDGKLGAVTHWYGYDLVLLEVGPDALTEAGRVEVGPEPRGVVLSADGRWAFVAVGVANEVVKVDVTGRTIAGRLEVGREPRGLALTADGRTLVVGNSRGQSLSVVDVESWSVVRTVAIESANLRQVAVGPDDRHAYVATMKNRGFATTKNNIDQGWVLGQRVTRIDLAGSSDYESLALDPRGKASSDVHGVALNGDGSSLAVSCGGTHEVLLFRMAERDLPWRLNGSRDLIPAELLREDGRYRRVAVGGRPTELAFAPDGKTLFVANYLGDSVQVVDAERGELVRTIPLGAPSELSLARRGEILFHEAERSFNQWYSCNTCHSDGHTNGLDFDTMNDGWHDLSTAHLQSRKKVPSMRRVTKTGPWTWHGWQTSLDDAMVESFTKSMQGPQPSPDEVRALIAYLDTLDYPRNPHRGGNAATAEAVKRGEEIFRSSKAACNTCHGGPEFTDGKIHTVGLEERRDVYRGYNPPSLRGLYDKDPYLHDGRAATLREALQEGHDPEMVTGLGALSEAELEDLVAYLRTL